MMQVQVSKEPARKDSQCEAHTISGRCLMQQGINPITKKKSRFCYKHDSKAVAPTKFAPSIKFQRNFNNKLSTGYFTTLRLHTEEKELEIKQNMHKIHDVRIGHETFCKARLMQYTEIKLRDVPEHLAYTDAGMNQMQLYRTLQRIYYQKDEWKEWDTPLLLLLFQKYEK